MADRMKTFGGGNCPPTLEQEWKNEYGEPLLNALCWIARWRMEAREDKPREITYQEFYFRVKGALRFDGRGYQMEIGVAEVIAEMGSPGLLRATSSTELDSDLGPIPRLNYELARHVARTNSAAGIELPSRLRAFNAPVAKELKRGRGRDLEDLLLFRTLAWWGVDRAVKLGLHADKTRERAEKTRKDLPRPAAQLVADAFAGAGLGALFTYNSVVSAWEAHRHEGADDRKHMVKSQRQAIQRRFREIDELLAELPRCTTD